MTIREHALKAFPSSRKARYSIFDMASVLWPKVEAEKLRHVSGWVDLLDMPVGDMGPTGIGGLLTFMEADLAVSYLPAWLVLAYERPFPFAGLLPALVGAIDDKVERDEEDQERFEAIRADLSESQREFVAHALDQMADVHFRSKPELKARLERMAQFWRSGAKPS